MSATTTRILGIDPGSRTTGYGIIESSGHKSQHVAHGCLAVAEGTLPQRLLQILDGLGEIIREYAPQEIAIEETFVNRANPQSALVLGQARGAAVCAIARAGLPMSEYAAAQVKVALVGNGRAEKQQVQHMVKLLLSMQGRIAADAADALAVALTHAHVRGTRVRSGLVLNKAWG